MKKFITACICTALSLAAFTACCEDEPEVLKPEVVKTAPILSGVVTTNGGAMLQGTKITVTGAGQTFNLTSDANGEFFSELVAGTFTVQASYTDEYSTAESEFTVEDGDIEVLNVLLLKTEVVTAEAYPEGGVAEVPVPDVLGDTSSGSESQESQSVVITYPAGAVDEEDEFVVEFSYGDDGGTKASVTELLQFFQATISTKSGKALNKDVKISFPIDADPDVFSFNGDTVEYTVTTKSVDFYTKDLGTIIVKYNVDMVSSESTVPVTFDQSEYDNMYGDKEIKIENPAYSMKVGGSVEGRYTLVNQVAAIRLGISKVKTVKAEFPLTATVPVGTKLTLTGNQTVLKTEFKLKNKSSISATVTEYTGVSLQAASENRHHTGGSN